MSTFRPYEPEQQLLLPPSLREWLPPDHLVWFISETVDQLDLDAILEKYRDGGQGICRFREQHLESFERLFVQVVLIAGEFNLICLALNLRRMANMIRWAQRGAIGPSFGAATPCSPH